MKKALVLIGLAIVVVVAVVVMMKGPNGSAAAPVPFTTLAEGQESKVTSRTNYLIRTQDELNTIWSFLEQPPPVPVVDFNTKVVAAVFAGQLPTAGYSIAVAAVEDASDRMVKIEVTKPDQSCVLAQATTAPYQIVELPKTSLTFTHEDISTIKPCP